jgi:UDP-GlcNAc:undecaprenyl-phosphate/decaprenyl-phosphate GlcNAc-1-phosphate transferase
VLDHAVVGLVAAAVTAALTPLVARLSRRMRAVRWRAGEGPGAGRPARTVIVRGRPDGRVPLLGGLAMFGGLVVALAVAAPLGAFAEVFESTSEPVALLVGATAIVILGALDDVLDFSAALKLAGQIVAATLVAALGLQLQFFWLPSVGVVALSSDLGLVLTVLFLVAFINLVNLVDGLDGLAAGVAGIGAAAFLLYSLRGGGAATSLLSSATLLAVITIGVAAGFLVHNWYPARIFMGDTGSMLLGLLLGAAGVAHVGRSSSPTASEFVASVPLVVPLIVLAVPLVDTLLTIVRRLRRDQPVTRADLGHLHHALVAAGHPHRRAVLVLYGWSFAAGLAVVGPLYLPVATVAALLLIVVLIVMGFTLVGLHERDASDPEAGRSGRRPGTGEAAADAGVVSARARDPI